MMMLVKKHKAQFILVGIASLIFAVASVGISLVLQHAIDDAIEGDVRQAVLLAVIFFLLFSVIYTIRSIGEVYLNQTVMSELRSSITSKILHKTMPGFREYKETDYISLVQNDVKRIEDSYTKLVFSCVIAVSELVLAIIVMTHYSWKFTVVMLGMTLLMFSVPAIFSKKLAAATVNISQAQENLTEGLTEAIKGFSVITHFQKIDYQLNKFQKRNLLLKKAATRLGCFSKINGVVSNVLAFSMQMVICILAGWLIYKGNISYGSMVGVIQVSGSITNPVFQLFTWIPELKSLKPIMEKLENYMNSNDSAEQCDMEYHDKTDWQKLVLQNVSFTYPGENTPVFTNLNLTIEKGKKYLIIGESGCGKTSLIELLTGNYCPNEGTILLDGLHTVSQRKLQKITSIVEQNIFIFNESISENIQLGEPNLSRLTNVIEQAGLKSVIEEKGLDYIVGSDGDQLSGGQKQRIAIARALYAGRDILILDEGSSALDPDTAFAVESGILENKNLTVLVVSHNIDPRLREKYDAVIYKKDDSFTMHSVFLSDSKYPSVSQH